MRSFAFALALVAGVMAGLAGGENYCWAGKPPAHYLLILDNTSIGEVRAANVKVSNVKPDPKKPGTVPPVDAGSFEVTVPLHKSLVGWISKTLDGRFSAQNGTIAELNSTLHEQAQIVFQSALLTEVSFPAMDSSSKDTGHLTIKFAPEFTRFNKGSGKVDKIAASSTKPWVTGNFRLSIKGLDTSQIRHIDSFSVRQKVVAERIGTARVPTLHPGKVEFPNLKVTLTLKTAKEWIDWLEDTVRGKTSKDLTKTGSLTLLSADHKQELATLNFHGLGISKLTKTKTTGGGEARVTVDLYCERMSLTGMK